MGYQYTKDQDIKIILERRKEIDAKIYKLQVERQALEHILLDLHNYEHPTGISIDSEIEKLQKLKEEERKFSGAARGE